MMPADAQIASLWQSTLFQYSGERGHQWRCRMRTSSLDMRNLVVPHDDEPSEDTVSFPAESVARMIFSIKHLRGRTKLAALKPRKALVNIGALQKVG